MITITFIKEIKTQFTTRRLFKKGKKFYVTSNNGMETLVFPSDENGDITSWNEVVEPWANKLVSM